MMKFYELIIYDKNYIEDKNNLIFFSNSKIIKKEIKLENLNLELIFNYNNEPKIKLRNLSNIKILINNDKYLEFNNIIILDYLNKININFDDNIFDLKSNELNNFNFLEKISYTLKKEFQCCFCFSGVENYIQFNSCIHFGCGVCITFFVKNKINSGLFGNIKCPICKENITLFIKNRKINDVINLCSNFEISEEYNKNKKQDYFLLNNILEIENIDKFSDFVNECWECKTPRINDNFQCSINQKHLKCFSCKRKYPERKEYIQTCYICDKNYCNLYLGDCSGNILFLNLKDLLENNKYNFDIDFINEYESSLIYNLKNKLNYNLIDIYDKYIKKNNSIKYQKVIFNNLQEFSSSLIEINIKDIIISCSDCFENIKLSLLIWFKKKYNNQLPENEKNKIDCWYGKNCRTMKYNIQHKKKLNHLCFQIKY